MKKMSKWEYNRTKYGPKEVWARGDVTYLKLEDKKKGLIVNYSILVVLIIILILPIELNFKVIALFIMAFWLYSFIFFCIDYEHNPYELVYRIQLRLCKDNEKKKFYESLFYYPSREVNEQNCGKIRFGLSIYNLKVSKDMYEDVRTVKIKKDEIIYSIKKDKFFRQTKEDKKVFYKEKFKLSYKEELYSQIQRLDSKYNKKR